MKLKLILAGAILSVSSWSVAQEEKITFDKAKTSYAVGYRMGIEFLGRKGSEFELDVEKAIQGIRDAAAKKDPSVSKEDMVLNFQNYEMKMKQKQLEALKKLADENKKRSDNFLVENRKKKGIIELPSGIQYRIIEDGKGTKPTMDSEVTIHYRGSLLGTKDANIYQEFDSSFVRGEPKTFKVNSVLKGWQDVLPMMRPGDKWQVFLPPELAYGVRGQPPVIGPNEVLIFDINLLDVK